MLAYSYLDQNKFGFTKKPVPQIVCTRDAIVKVMLASVCTSDLHIKGGHVPRAVRGVTVGHEMVGVVEKVGKDVRNVKAGDRVCVNVRHFAANVSSAIAALSTTVPIRSAAGRSAAASTAGSHPMYACRLPIGA